MTPVATDHSQHPDDRKREKWNRETEHPGRHIQSDLLKEGKQAMKKPTATNPDPIIATAQINSRPPNEKPPRPIWFRVYEMSAAFHDIFVRLCVFRKGNECERHASGSEHSLQVIA